MIAEALGCEAIATTLSGYTDKPAPKLPNLKLVEDLAKRVKVPIIAEGGFNRPEQFKQALDAGAWSVCIWHSNYKSVLAYSKFSKYC